MIWDVLIVATVIGLAILGTLLVTNARAPLTRAGRLAMAAAWLGAATMGFTAAGSVVGVNTPSQVDAVTAGLGIYVIVWFFILTIVPAPLLTRRAPPED